MLIVHILAHAWFVQQIETNLFAVYILIEFRPHIPVKTECIQRGLVFPQIVWLIKSGINTVTRRSMKIEAYMHPVLVSELNKTTNFINSFIIDTINFLCLYTLTSVEFE